MKPWEARRDEKIKLFSDALASSRCFRAGEIETLTILCTQVADWARSECLADAAGLVSALEQYIISRKVVDKELDWDAFEKLELALTLWKGGGE